MKSFPSEFTALKGLNQQHRATPCVKEKKYFSPERA